MSSLGQLEADSALRRVDRKNNFETIVYLGDPDDVLWSSATLLIPSDILDAYIMAITVRSNAATAPHEVDATSLRECFVMWVSTQGGGVRGQVASPPIQSFNDANEVGVGNWITTLFFPEEFHHVTRDDSIGLWMPPAEDNVADTGTYIINLMLRGLRYTKK